MPSDSNPFVVPEAAEFVLTKDQLTIISWLVDPKTDPEDIARRLMEDASDD